MSPPGRFHILETDSLVIRDEIEGLNYHFNSALEAANMLFVLIALETDIRRLQDWIEEAAELSEEDTATTKLFTEKNLVEETEDFSKFPDGAVREKKEDTHG